MCYLLIFPMDDPRELVGRRRRDAKSLHNRGVVFAAGGEFRRSYLFHRAAADARPEDAGYVYDAGTAAHALGLADEAALYLDRALRIDPNHARAWRKRGEVYCDALKPEDALRSYRRAIELAPEDSGNYLSAARCVLCGDGYKGAVDRLRDILPHAAGPFCVERGVALALAERGDYEEAVPILSDIVRHAPEDYIAMRVLGEIYTGLREWSAAQFWYERAIAGNDMEAIIGWVLHWSRLGDFERGRQIYRSLIRGLDFDSALMRPAARRWEGQDLHGKTLHLIAGDVYLGDALQYVRFARVAKEAGATVIVQTPRRLRSLLRTVDGVDSVTVPHDPVPAADYEGQAFWLLYALPVPIAEMIGVAPYLTSPADLRARWRDRIPRSPGTKVGLVWRGSSWRMRDRFGRRSMALEDLRPLASIPQVTLYSLQYGEGRTELLEAHPPFPAIDLAPDLPNTCAAIEALDLVVTIDTSIAHLAGALGKHTFLMLPYDACFRWMVDRDDTPWYPSLRLFRQSRPGEWSDVVKAIAQALQRELPRR